MIHRGTCVGPETTIEQVKEILEMGANLIRYQIAPSRMTPGKDFWWSEVERNTGQLVELAKAVPAMVFLADLHRLSEADGSVPTFEVEKAWKYICKELAGVLNVKFAGVLNEPPMSFDRCKDVMLAASGVIGPKVKVLTFPYSDPPHFRHVKPYGVKKAQYEVHMYMPLEFTQQGIDGRPTGKTYPGEYEIGGKVVLVDKERLKKFLQPVRTFQLTHRRKILVGEFSASNYADEHSRLNYLKDCIDIFEEYGWHWCYHAMGIESSVWLPSPSVKALLKEYWERNHEK